MTAIDFPELLNAAVVFVDSHLDDRRDEKAAILCRDRAITYRDLYQNVNRFGSLLRRLDTRMEERVAILMPDSPEWVFAFFGAMKIGAVAVPLNTLLKAADYRYMLNDSRARVLVVHGSILDRVLEVRSELKYLEHVIVAGDDGLPADEADPDAGLLDLQALLDEASPELTPAETSKDDAAFWLYSSGTTGFPKGTIHLHHDMIVEADLYARDTIGVQESDVCFSVAKLFFAYGLGNGLYFSLRVGGTTVLLPDRPMPEVVFDVIDRYGVTVFYSVPTSYAALLHEAEKTDRNGLGKVRMCVSAGETLPATLFERWRQRFALEILDGIGSTEILHIFISNRPRRAVAGSTGEIVPGYEARIVDEDENEVPVGTIGTLWIKGDSIAAGYWNKHEQTKETYRGHWINTRDKFLIDPNGYFWYAGRVDDMMKVSGQAVWPTEVEGILQRHEAVLESGVVGADDRDGLTKAVAYVVLKNPADAGEDLARELQQFVKGLTAPHKYPRAVVFVEALPKTATGKIKRFQLRERAEEEKPLHPKA